MIETHRSQFVLGTDIRKGPLEKAEEQIDIAELTYKRNLVLRRGNAFSPIYPKDRINTIVISGIGGELMSKILGKFPYFLLRSLLILEANNEVPLVRKKLQSLNFQIQSEQIIEEKKHFYEILTAKYINKPISLTDEQIYFGPLLLKKKSSIFLKKWKKEFLYKKKILNILKKNNLKKSKRFFRLSKENYMINNIIE